MRECCQACRQLESGYQPTGRLFHGTLKCELLWIALEYRNVKTINTWETAPKRMSRPRQCSVRGPFPFSLSLHGSLISPRLPAFAQPFNPSAAAHVLAWIKGVQWIWHCNPNGHHPSASVTLSLGIIPSISFTPTRRSVLWE
jgi:hypothetical protein